jgi:hypothetical protein
MARFSGSLRRPTPARCYPHKLAGRTIENDGIFETNPRISGAISSFLRFLPAKDQRGKRQPKGNRDDATNCAGKYVAYDRVSPSGEKRPTARYRTDSHSPPQSPSKITSLPIQRGTLRNTFLQRPPNRQDLVERQGLINVNSCGQLPQKKGPRVGRAVALIGLQELPNDPKKQAQPPLQLTPRR